MQLTGVALAFFDKKATIEKSFIFIEPIKINREGEYMCLRTDPTLTVWALKSGRFSKECAQKEITDLKSEISSGIYTLEQMGLGSEEELDDLINYSKTSEQ